VWRFWGSILVAIIGGIALYLARPVPVETRAIQRDTTQPVNPTSKNHDSLQITHPGSAAEVGLNEVVQGWSPLPDLNHYILITNQSDRIRKVAIGPFRPAADGSFAVTTKFGESKLGIAEQFIITVVATTARLNEGADASTLPAGAVESATIMVHRKH
jgi:hypothetical protein